MWRCWQCEGTESFEMFELLQVERSALALFFSQATCQEDCVFLRCDHRVALFLGKSETKSREAAVGRRVRVARKTSPGKKGWARQVRRRRSTQLGSK